MPSQVTRRHSPTARRHSPTARRRSPTARRHSPTARRHSPTARRRSPTARRRFRSAGRQVVQMQNVLRQLADASQVNPALTSLQVLQAVKPLVIRQLQAENAPAQKVAAMKVALDKFDAQLNARSAQYMQQLGKEAVQAYGVYTLGLLGKQLGKYDYLNLQVYARPHFFMLVILKMMYDAGFVDISVLPNAFAFMGKIYMRGFTDYIMTYVEEALRQLPRYFPYAAF